MAPGLCIPSSQLAGHSNEVRNPPREEEGEERKDFCPITACPNGSQSCRDLGIPSNLLALQQCVRSPVFPSSLVLNISGNLGLPQMRQILGL